MDAPADHLAARDPENGLGGPVDEDKSADTFEEVHSKDLMSHAQVKKEIQPIDPDVRPPDDEVKTKKPEPPPEFIAVDTALDDKKPEVSSVVKGPALRRDLGLEIWQTGCRR